MKINLLASIVMVSPTSILLKNNNLHFDIIIDPKSDIGKNDKANISDFMIGQHICN